MTSEVLGEYEGSGHDLDGLPMASIVYVGRESFRMEAIALEPGLARNEGQGIVQPITSMKGIVTAPLHTTPRPIVYDGVPGDGVVSHAPPLRSLFSSQISVPRLAAPSGAIDAGSSRVTITRASLVTLGALVLLCGIVVGTAARHLLASPAPLAVVASPAAPRVAPVVAAPVVAPPVPAPVLETAPPSPPPTLAVPSPVRVHVHAKPAVAKAPASAAAPTTSAPKAWVDPWAE